MLENLRSATLLQLADALTAHYGLTFIVSTQYQARRNVASIKAEMDRRDREAAKSRGVYLVLGEHFTVPGLVQKVFVTKAAANTEALELVNLMLMECERKPATNWRRGLKWLQDNRGNCDVIVNELKLIDD